MKPRTSYIRRFACSLLKKHGVDSPPVDLELLLQKEGLEYQEIEYFEDDVDALIIQFEGRFIAAVNKKHHFHRRRFSLAHELCHHLLHQDRSVLEDRVTIDSTPEATSIHSKDVFESEADIFAGELLVPLQFLKTTYKKGMTAADISQIFQVSEQVAGIALSNHFTSLFK